MNKVNKNESGFSAVEVTLVIVIVALIGVVGWLVYKDNHKTTTAAVATTAKSTTTPTKTTTTPAQPASPYAGWDSYKLTNEKLTFMYPSGWTISNTTASTSTQDSVTFTAADGFTFNVLDGEGNGGDTIPEAPSNSAVPVTFVGQSDYLVYTYGTGSRGAGTSDGMISGAVLQTSTNENGGPNGEYPWPTDKYAVGPNDTTGAINAMYFSISCNTKSQLTLQQAQSNSDYKTAALIIESANY